MAPNLPQKGQAALPFNQEFNMSNKRFDSEESANQYKDKHQLHQYVPMQVTGTSKWAFCFPIESHITVNDGVSAELRKRSQK